MRVSDLYQIPDGIYLASHSVGPLSRKGRDYLERSYLGCWTETGADAWGTWLDLIAKFNTALGTLIGAADREISPQISVSAAYYNFLTSLPASQLNNQQGRQSSSFEVLMHETAFPSLRFVLDGLSRRNWTVRLIPNSEPATDPDVWARHVSPQTRVALLTHAHSNTGVLTPVADISPVLKQRGVLTVLDVAQSIGVCPVNVAAFGVDAIIGSCVKWLCGGPGAGFIWVRPQLLETLKPELLGWFSHKDPFEFDIHNFELHQDAQKFWGGTPSIAPYATALGGIETALDLGVDAIRQQNLECMQYILQDLDPNTQSGTLCLPVNDISQNALKRAGVMCDFRGQIARLSFHVFNTAEQAQLVADCLRGDIRIA